MTRAFLALALLCACPSPDPKQGIDPANQPDALLDYNDFVCNVQPVLIRRCSYLGCHGNPQHAMRLYSPGKLRAADDGTRNGRDGMLSGIEVELNFQSASGLVLTATPAERAAPNLQKVLLLGKPLARRAGGAEHHGVGIFPVFPAKTIGEDLEFAALVAWVQGAKLTQPLDSACQSVFQTMGLTPR
jgi:hypothetical protein